METKKKKIVRSVVFCSRKKAEQLDPIDNCAMISITNPGDSAALKDGWGAVLRLGFHDIDLVQLVSPFLRAQVEGYYTVMMPQQAQRIVEFVGASISSGITDFVVHCEQGVSRSAAVAKWIDETHGKSELTDHSTMLHNKHVYSLLSNATPQNPD